jgi:hypothetical protein
VADSLTYYDALKILGTPRKSRLAAVLDAAAKAGLAALAAGSLAGGRDPGPALDLLELAGDITGYGQDVFRRVGEWRSGLSRFDRSQRLAAAHAVLVVASYFAALEAAGLPGTSRLGLSAAEQAALAVAAVPPAGYAGVISVLVSERLPMPEPYRTYAQTREQVGEFYRSLSRRVAGFISGLAAWDDLDDDGRLMLGAGLDALPPAALDRYDSGYRDLTVDNREFEVWAWQAESRAAGSALAGMSALLAGMTARQPGSRPLIALRRTYQSALGEPVAGSGDAPEGVVLPSLEEAYVTPACRVAEVGPGGRPAEAAWWRDKDLVPDTEAFLAGYLTLPRAARAPLVVLGEPGSGKSKLAQVLAARLPEADFLPVLVELREVAAESMIQEQVEQAIYRGPGERVSWPDLADAAGGALPVIILDGFDELVQAAAVNRYDYLEQARDFQARQERAGHPVVVIVTTRTVVADQARFPAGTIALQLQPFTPDQVTRWLGVWDRHNAAGLEGRGLRPLPAAAALAHGALAGQPLLLLMLALFDAAGNDLQHEGTPVGQAELYEKLLAEFARREVSKSARSRALPASRQSALADRELHRLGIVALAMFARGRQTASEVELNQDLGLLFPDDEPADPDAGLTPAQRAAGRFFFVSRSEARTREDRARSYEFLHATFGEFLVARLTLTALRNLVALRRATRREMITAGRLDDGFAYAVLSFACLAGRSPVISFLGELLDALPARELTQVRELLSELIAQSLTAHPARSLAGYEPVRHPVPRRLAAYSANLVILLVLAAGQVNAQEFSDGGEPAVTWARYGYLWRSALTPAEWEGLTDTIRARVVRADGRTQILLGPEDGSPVSPTDSIVITDQPDGMTDFEVLLTRHQGLGYDADIRSSTWAGRVFRHAAFTPDWQAAMLLLHAVPAIRALGGGLRQQSVDGATLLPGYLLASLDYERGAPDSDRLAFYEFCLNNASSGLLEQLLLRLASDVSRFPAETICRLLTQSAAPLAPTRGYAVLLNTLWRQADTGSRKQVITLVRDLQHVHPADQLAGIDQDLRAAACNEVT